VEVWREISNYLENDVDPTLRSAMDEHLQGCKGCRAVLDGTRNVVQLYGDDRMTEVPLGFSHRLQRGLEENLYPARRTFLGWMVAAAAAILVAGGLEVARSSSLSRPGLRSEHAQPAAGVPPEMMVLVATDGKTFHVAGCRFIHDKEHLRTLTAREALHEGYAPCIRCMRKYLSASPLFPPRQGTTSSKKG
ncbi:MAG TPA: zf-HC2 domain-containing protein, partial [Terriglobales bacterium]|nr:zf-HC2 domain-containing protein [Terriglobales bacterium]